MKEEPAIQYITEIEFKLKRRRAPKWSKPNEPINEPEQVVDLFRNLQNETVRIHARRLSRLTNAFSKKKENLEAALALHFCYYNFVMPHISLNGATPAMAAGKTNRF